MTSIRESIVCWLCEQLKVALPDYDVRRVRRRPVDKLDKASVSINMIAEATIDSDIHGEAESTGTIEVVLAAMTDDGDAELDPIVTEVHRALHEDDTCGGNAEKLAYTGCTWAYEEGGDGMAVVATMAFEVIYLHKLTDMAESA